MINTIDMSGTWYLTYHTCFVLLIVKLIINDKYYCMHTDQSKGPPSDW